MKTRSDLIGQKYMVDADTDKRIPVVAAFDITEYCPCRDVSIAPKVLLTYIRARKGLIAELRFCERGEDPASMSCFWFVDGLADARSDENAVFLRFAEHLGLSYATLYELVKAGAPTGT